jgi:hypothetical protein
LWERTTSVEPTANRQSFLDIEDSEQQQDDLPPMYGKADILAHFTAAGDIRLVIAEKGI